MTTESGAGRLLTLDAMRGVAALLVVVYHFGEMAPAAAPSGYLAVDFFFVLSGLVIARTYDARLAQGLSPAGFIERRLIRLYPLYLAGLLLGVLVAVARVVTHDANAIPVPALAADAGLGTLMLPATAPATDETFPLNGPEWSLFLEMLANVVYAFLALKLGCRSLAALIVTAGAGMLWSGASHGSLDMGGDWTTMTGGLLRLAFSFSAGVLIHRSGLIASRGRSWAALAPVALLAAALVAAPSGAARGAYDGLFALLVSPLLVILGARYEPPAAVERPAHFLGEISYPVYAIHFPLIFIAGFVAHRLGLSPIQWLPAFLVMLVVAAYAASRLFDRPVRARLTAWLRARRAA